VPLKASGTKSGNAFGRAKHRSELYRQSRSIWERNRGRVVRFLCTHGRNITGGGLPKPKSGPPKPLTPPGSQPSKKRLAIGSRSLDSPNRYSETISRRRQGSAGHGTNTSSSHVTKRLRQQNHADRRLAPYCLACLMLRELVE
jgi:hypothetical protein